MQDKAMVNDTLTGINGELIRFGEMIPQTENRELKQTPVSSHRKSCISWPVSVLIMFPRRRRMRNR